MHTSTAEYSQHRGSLVPSPGQLITMGRCPPAAGSRLFARNKRILTGPKSPTDALKLQQYVDMLKPQAMELHDGLMQTHLYGAATQQDLVAHPTVVAPATPVQTARRASSPPAGQPHPSAAAMNALPTLLASLSSTLSRCHGPQWMQARWSCPWIHHRNLRRWHWRPLLPQLPPCGHICTRAAP